MSKRHEPINCVECGQKIGFWEVRDTPHGLIRHWFLTAKAVPVGGPGTMTADRWGRFQSATGDERFACRECPECATTTMKARTMNANESTGGVL